MWAWQWGCGLRSPARTSRQRCVPLSSSEDVGGLWVTWENRARPVPWGCPNPGSGGSAAQAGAGQGVSRATGHHSQSECLPGAGTVGTISSPGCPCLPRSRESGKWEGWDTDKPASAATPYTVRLLKFPPRKSSDTSSEVQTFDSQLPPTPSSWGRLPPTPSASTASWLRCFTLRRRRRTVAAFRSAPA